MKHEAANEIESALDVVRRTAKRAFFEVLRDWRAEGDLRGLELS